MTPPAVRVIRIVAAGRVQVATPLALSVNFTGTTPFLELKVLLPSALIGCWMLPL